MKLKPLRFVADGRRALLLDTKYEKDIASIFTYSVPGAYYMPQVRQGNWDGTICMLSNHIVPIGLLKPPEIRKQLLDLGFEVKLKSWSNRPTFTKRVGFEEKDKNYKYQNDAVNAMHKAISFGGGLVISATGSGKTKTAAQFMSWITDPCLFIVDQVDLLYQSAKELESWLKKPVGIVGNSKFAPTNNITVATIQTLHKHSESGSSAFRKWLHTIKIVIIDELHTQIAKRNFSVVNEIQPAAVFGLTATLELKKKHIRMKAYSICGPVLYEFPIAKGTATGVLSTGVGIQVHIPDKSNFKPAQMSLFVPPRLRMRQRSDEYDKLVVRNEDLNNVVASFITHAISRDYCCVVLVERVNHLKILKKMFKERGIMPTMCYGAVSAEERKEARTAFEKGSTHLILANKVFTKGINIKRVDLIADLAQRSNKNDVIQKFGRGVRLHSDKTGLLYFDFVVSPHFENPAKKRLSALRSAKIPVQKITMSTSQEILKIGEKLLTKTLKEAKNGHSK